tara:strand:+ start:789 stop:1109 length:321 start_codon:yes stop_codon:yes gene_type:complete
MKDVKVKFETISKEIVEIAEANQNRLLNDELNVPEFKCEIAFVQVTKKKTGISATIAFVTPTKGKIWVSFVEARDQQAITPREDGGYDLPIGKMITITDGVITMRQ